MNRSDTCPQCGALWQSACDCDRKRIAELAEQAAQLAEALAAERSRTDAFVDALVNNKSQGLLGELIAEVRKDRGSL
jgi:hypothetical protein